MTGKFIHCRSAFQLSRVASRTGVDCKFYKPD
jgi:hypothetical protein